MAHLEKHGAAGDMTDVLLLKAQVHLKQGDLRRSVEALRGVEKLKHELGLAATLVVAYERQGSIDDALEVLDEAIAYWTTEGNAANVLTLTEESAKLLLKHRRWEAAAERFKRVQKLGKTDAAVTARLGMCMAHIDVSAAETLCNDLDELCVASEISPTQAEDLLALKVKEMAAAQPAVEQEAKKEVKKKRKPGKKPEGATGEPDTERWWAKKDRASYKVLSKRQLREQKKETQESKKKRQRIEASERETLKQHLKLHYEELREKEAK